VTRAEAEKVFSLLPQPLRVFTRKGDEHFGMVAGNPAQLRNIANWAEAEEQNVYLQMNPSDRISGTRVAADEIRSWCWFLVDIDPVEKKALEEYGFLEMAADRVQGMLQGYLGLEKIHRTVVDSGRGIQIWYPLGPEATDRRLGCRTAPWSGDLDEIEKDVELYSIAEAAQRAMSYWLKFLRERLPFGQIGDLGCVIDLSVSDLPRVMRCPFTVNTKTGRRTRLLMEARGANPTLADKLLKYAPHHVWKRPDAVCLTGATESTPWQVFVPHMTVAGRRFIQEGTDEGGRHFAAVAAARSLRDLGCSAVQARLAVLEGWKRCTPNDDVGEVDTIIRRNFARQSSQS